MKNNLLAISIAESIYLVYMFHFYKTSLNFNILPELSLVKNNNYFKHLSDDTCGLRICLFGRIVIFLLIGVLLLRNVYPITKFHMNVVLIISFILSLMNLNAVVFLIPFWTVEIVYVSNII
tara:strand:- start:910 stop:1272 length:363 start_codon:yes stop_codon:yes gene_type:complete